MFTHVQFFAIFCKFCQIYITLPNPVNYIFTCNPSVKHMYQGGLSSIAYNNGFSNSIFSDTTDAVVVLWLLWFSCSSNTAWFPLSRPFRTPRGSASSPLDKKNNKLNYFFAIRNFFANNTLYETYQVFCLTAPLYMSPLLPVNPLLSMIQWYLY